MFEPITQGFALHQLGHHVTGAGWQRSDVVKCADVGMIQCRYRPRLAFESLAELLRGNFDGYSAVQTSVHSAVDFPHPALTERAYNMVWSQPRSGRQDRARFEPLDRLLRCLIHQGEGRALS